MHFNELLAPSQNIQLTNFVDGPAQGFADSASSAGKLLAAAQAAQGTPQGRARLALVSAFLNVSPWGGPTIPGMYDYVGQEQGQYADYFTSGPFKHITFIVEGRDQIEAAAGGEGSGTVGVDFARLLHDSSYYEEVRALYNEAGLSLRSDLKTLARNANLKPDKAAYRWLARTSVPTGRLRFRNSTSTRSPTSSCPSSRNASTTRLSPGPATVRCSARPSSRPRDTATSPRPTWWPASTRSSSGWQTAAGATRRPPAGSTRPPRRCPPRSAEVTSSRSGRTG